MEYEPKYLDELYAIIRDKNNKEKIGKLFLPPWRGTIRKFNEIFEFWDFQIQPGKSYYQVVKNYKLVCNMRSVSEFMKLLEDVFKK